MKKNLISSLAMGFGILIIGSLLYTLLAYTKGVSIYGYLIVLAFSLIFAFRVGSYKENVVEDERLLKMREKAQALAFDIANISLLLLPALLLVYSTYINNSSFTLMNQSLTLQEFGEVLMMVAIGVTAFSAVVRYIAEKILMQP